MSPLASENEGMAGKKTCAVSVVIPVYNTAPYLRDCLDSLVKQTLRDIEIICVDDGSTDDSLFVLREYEQRDFRIVVIEQPHAGVSVARNRGVLQATGKYMVFVDSDDWVEPGFCRIPYEVAEQTGTEIVFFDWRFRYDKGGRHTRCDKGCGRVHVFHGENIPRGRLNARATVCGQLWQRVFWQKHGIRFPEGMRMGEDSVVLFMGVMAAGHVACVASMLYNYRQRQGSAGHGENDWPTHVEAVTNFVGFLRKIYMQTEEYDRVKLLITSVALHCYRYVYFQVPPVGRRDCADRILKALTDDDWFFLRVPGVLSWSRRLFYYALRGVLWAEVLNRLVMMRCRIVRGCCWR